MMGFRESKSVDSQEVHPSHSTADVTQARICILQFSIQEKRDRPSDAIPGWAPWLEREPRSAVDREPTGTLILEPTDDVGGLPVLEDLEGHGFVLTRVLYERRADAWGTQKHVLRFVFSSRPEDLDPEMDSVKRSIYLQSLREMLQAAMWRVRAYRNPWFQGGVLTGEYGICVNFDSRKPYLGSDGRFKERWEYGACGERIRKVRWAARQRLRLLDGLLQMQETCLE